MKFQFTPLREGRRAAYFPMYGDPLFQFTPLREGRHILSQPIKKSIYISIHAPTRGATQSLQSRGNDRDYFNSRPYARGDPDLITCGQRHSGYFNSRPYARGDKGQEDLSKPLDLISIHAPTRGATRE